MRCGDDRDGGCRALCISGQAPGCLGPAGAGPGRDRCWINEAEQLADTAEPQDANMCRGQLMTSLPALGLYRRAADLRSKVDRASWAKSPGFDGRLVDIQEWSARESATATASAPPGDEGDDAGDDDAGKDFVDLGVERRFTEQRRWPMPGADGRRSRLRDSELVRGEATGAAVDGGLDGRLDVQPVAAWARLAGDAERVREGTGTASLSADRRRPRRSGPARPTRRCRPNCPGRRTPAFRRGPRSPGR
jgi:hypothetical protein